MGVEDRPQEQEGSRSAGSEGLTRRRVLRTGAATGALTALSWGAAAGAARADADGTAGAGGAAPIGQSAGAENAWFSAPGRSLQPKFRWWWPDGLVESGELRREIDQIAD